jgi:hypothetical protein
MGCRLRWKRRGELLYVWGNYLAGQTNTRGEPNVIESITTFLACLSFVIGGAPASVVVLDQGA